MAVIRGLCRRQGIDYLLTRDFANIFRMTGLQLHCLGDALVLITPRRIVLCTDDRYRGTAERLVAGNPLIKLVICDKEGPLETLLRLVKKGSNLGFESDSESCSYKFVLKLRQAAKKRGVQTKAVKPIIEIVRLIKSPYELAMIRKSAALTDLAFRYILRRIKVGRTELELAHELSTRLRKLSGCDELSFPTIVASGPNSAIPHHMPGNRKLRLGDVITFDFGCIYKGYHSDMTRTVFLGEPSGKLREIYEIVLAAQQAAAKLARPGMTGQQIDRIARDIIIKAGYGKYFGHGLGHGIGIEEHEGPRVSPTSFGKIVVIVGMTHSIEPGIYIPGLGGVRIEDIGVVTKRGFRSFCRSTKKLVILRRAA